MHAGDPMQPSARPRLELELEGLCVQAEAFPPGGSHVRRSALSVRHAELRDCAPRPEGGSAWRRILAYHATSHVPRDAQACLFQVRLEAFCFLHDEASGEAALPRGAFGLYTGVTFAHLHSHLRKKLPRRKAAGKI